MLVSRRDKFEPLRGYSNGSFDDCRKAVMLEAEEAAPDPCAMITSMRAVGYKVETAIADLLDNSITAGAEHIRIRFEWNKGSPWFAMLDDGKGMSEAELITAMRPGSTDPLLTRAPNDLGRFGFGLKTASFSQAKILKVFALNEATSQVFGRCWDLDYVRKQQKWTLLKAVSCPDADGVAALERRGAGVLVVWECLDRLTSGYSAEEVRSENHFYEMIQSVRDHLGVLFHRYLSGSTSSGRRIRISINGDDPAAYVVGWDPFAKSAAAQDFGPEPVAMPDGSSIMLTGMVLPHRDKIRTDEEYQRISGPLGMTQHQGFYIYRCDRLLCFGEWLDLGEHRRKWHNEEAYRLARISIDLPNSSDETWKIDIKKSLAIPPPIIKARLISFTTAVRNKARKVFWQRERIGANPTLEDREATENVWHDFGSSRKLRFEINRNHPIVNNFREASGPLKPRLERILSLIERTVPVERIYIQANSPEFSPDAAFLGREMDEALKEELKILFAILLATYRKIERNRSKVFDQALEQISGIEPFNRFGDLTPYLQEFKK
jgi:hypothetical protein